MIAKKNPGHFAKKLDLKMDIRDDSALYGKIQTERL